MGGILWPLLVSPYEVFFLAQCIDKFVHSVAQAPIKFTITRDERDPYVEFVLLPICFLFF